MSYLLSISTSIQQGQGLLSLLRTWPGTEQTLKYDICWMNTWIMYIFSLILIPTHLCTIQTSDVIKSCYSLSSLFRSTNYSILFSQRGVLSFATHFRTTVELLKILLLSPHTPDHWNPDLLEGGCGLQGGHPPGDFNVQPRLSITAWLLLFP